MTTKPAYEELEKRINNLEKQVQKTQKVEKALQESEERFRLLYERAPLAYQSLDENGCLIEVNEAWLDMLGYTREEVVGRSVADFLSPEFREHFEQHFPRFKSVGEVLGVEFELRKKDGTPVLISVNGKIGLDSEGNFKQTHCILYDITARDRADNERDQIIADLQRKLAKAKEVEKTIVECPACKKKTE
jgi:PAS domain S-box-containing protein